MSRRPEKTTTVEQDPVTSGADEATSDVRVAHDEVLEVRRSTGVFALVALASAALAVAYTVRAFESPALLLVVVTMAAIAAVAARGWVDSRSPLLVADGLGIRVRHGRSWRGLPWEQVDHVVLVPSRGVLRDGALEVVGDDGSVSVVPLGLAVRASREDTAAVLATLSGDPDLVVVPEPPVVEAPAADAAGAGAVDSDPETGELPADIVGDASPTGAAKSEDGAKPEDGTKPEDGAKPEAGLKPEDGGKPTDGAKPTGGGAPSGGAGTTSAPAPELVEAAEPQDVSVSAPALAAGPSRVDVHRSQGSTALAANPDVRTVTALRAVGGRPELVLEKVEPRTWPSSALGPGKVGSSVEAGEPVGDTATEDDADVMRDQPAPEGAGSEAATDDVVTADAATGDTVTDDAVARPSRTVWGRRRSAPEPEPEPGPSLGALLRAAREDAGLSVAALAERTQVREHVIESLEDDDPGPCGGDFYARGHVRTLASALRTDPAPLVEAFDTQHASDPVPARLVFEAERRSGTGAIRPARGGRSWMAIVAAVLVLAIVWGIGRVVTDGGGSAGPADLDSAPAAPVEGSKPKSMAPLAGPTTNHLVLRGKDGQPTRVKVRDSDGATVWSGRLARGDRQRVDVVGKARVTAARGDAVTVTVDGRKTRKIGPDDAKATREVGIA